MFSRSVSCLRLFFACVSCVALLAAAPAALAVPLTFDMGWGESGYASIDVPTAPISQDVYQAVGSWTHPAGAWTIDYEFEFDPDPWVQANYTITNNSANPIAYVFTVNLPVAPSLSPPNLMGGSVSGSLTDNNGNGATLTSNAPSAVYTALINGSPVATLLNDPFSISAGSFLSTTIGPQQFGTPIPGDPAPNVSVNDIGIELRFTLSPGDSAAFTSVLVVEPVPEPATAGLLGLGGLAFFRRRRRA